MGRKITDKVTWVGKVDWKLTTFHGEELSTHRGSSYNSYLIRDQKIALIDTVWQPFDKEFVANLAREVDLESIDYVIMNHNEIDHSGALPELMRYATNATIYCTAAGEKIIRGHYNEACEGWSFVHVKTGDKLSLGESTLTFIEAPMLHWPDTMFTYMSGENILFSNDGFGQHYACSSLFDDEADLDEVLVEAEKYYCNILNLYNKQMAKKLDEVLGLGLPLSLVCPSHGIIWRSHIQTIVDCYLKWSSNYQANQVTILFDTMWNATRVMAECIADGIVEADPAVKVKICDMALEDKNDIATEVFRSKAILVGSPTINYGISHGTAGMLELIKGLHFKNKKAAAFGSYGWSGNALAQLSEALSDMGFELVDDGIKSLWMPGQEERERIRQYGREFALKINPDAQAGSQADVQENAYQAKKYVCTICNYVYDPAKGDPDSGIEPGTPFEQIPDTWRCPLCGVGKDNFVPVDEA